MSKPMPPHLRRQAGFTLAEILVTTAIFAVIMLAALAVYDRSNKVFKSSSEAADMQQSTRIGFDKLMSEVRMLGFDYSRGGVPTGAGQFQQPDEQIEYAGMNVLAFRSNFDYVTNAANGNGLAPSSYTAINPATNLPYFPFITTTNEEIVVYALKSADPAANNGSISFWTDSSIPRAAYPGGNPESKVTFSNIDTTNDHPPYTLVRTTVADILANKPPVPVAENIRSLNFSYYTDTKGGTPLAEAVTGNAITASRNADGSTIAVPSDSGAIGGAGQYDPSNIGGTVNFSDRDRRALLTSIRVNLVGMNAYPDINYQNATETNASFKNYREYQLQALVVPRNLGLTGFPEPSFDHPGPPTITGICTGFCGAPVICWNPPTTGGPVDKFTIAWDTNPLGSFTAHTLDIYDPSATSATLKDDGASDISQTFYYQITAVNDNGSSSPSGQEKAVPLESTKPLLDATTTTLAGTDPSLANTQVNQITLTWTVPKINTTGTQNLNCSGSCGASGQNIPPTQETKLWEVWRSTDPSTAGIKILSFSDAKKQPASAVPGATVTWVDSALTSEVPPAACVQYYYRIRMASRCVNNDAWNVGTNPGRANDFVSDYFPLITAGVQNGIKGYATSTSTPAAPVGLAVDTTKSSCPAGLNGNCTIVLNWPIVTTDTAGNAIGVDVYRIKRSRKRSIDPTFTTDPTFTPVVLSGESQLTAGILSFTDTAPAYDHCTFGCTDLPWYYQYTVAAAVCGNYSNESNAAVYPTPCSVNPVIVQGGQLGNNSGQTPQTAWVFNAGDTITVSAPGGGPALTTVEFVVENYPGGGQVDDQTSKGPAFVYTWQSQAQGTYRVTILSTNVNGCTEIDIRYVSEQPPAPCSFPALTTLPTVNVNKQNGGFDTATMDFQLTNGGADTMNFFISGSFQGQETTTWKDPDGQHPDLVQNLIQYTSNGTQTTDNVQDPPSGTIGTQTLTTTHNEPSNLASLPANKQLTLHYQWTYNTAKGKPDPDLKTSPVQKLCITYQIPSEPGVTKKCNLVGQAKTTNNPNSCD